LTSTSNRSDLASDSSAMLSFQKLREGAGRRTTADQARFYTIARGSAMEAAAALDTLRE